jgi:hypothetical protein
MILEIYMRGLSLPSPAITPPMIGVISGMIVSTFRVPYEPITRAVPLLRKKIIIELFDDGTATCRSL